MHGNMNVKVVKLKPLTLADLSFGIPVTSVTEIFLLIRS